MIWMTSHYQPIWKVNVPIRISKTLQRTKIFICNCWSSLVRHLSSPFMAIICLHSTSASMGPTMFFHKGFGTVLFQMELSRHVHQSGWKRWDEMKGGRIIFFKWSTSLQSCLHHALFSLSLCTGSSGDIALQCACSMTMFVNKVRSKTPK